VRPLEDRKGPGVNGVFDFTALQRLAPVVSHAFTETAPRLSRFPGHSVVVEVPLVKLTEAKRAG